jgi:hypothetical protein
MPVKSLVGHQTHEPLLHARPELIPRVHTPSIDLARVLAEDAAQSGPLPEGVVGELARTMDHGAFIPLPDGSLRWMLDVHAPGAFGVRLHLAQLALPEGVSLLVYDPTQPNNLPAPITGTGPLGDGKVWAWTSWSETARIEVHIPVDAQAQLDRSWFTIDRFAHIYRNPTTGTTSAFDTRELPCHVDVQCFPQWSTQRDGIGRMSFVLGGRIYACSGSLVATGAGDLTPYFLAARHCLNDSTEAFESLEVYWFFQSASCNAPPPPIGSVPRTERSTYVYTSVANDVSLAMLSGTIPFGVWWNGVAWMPSLPSGTQVVGIHHPDGTHKRISIGSVVTEQTSCSSSLLAQGTEITWTTGMTEPGSSGSPLMLLDGRIVGVDSCGTANRNCTFRGTTTYGRWGNAMPALQSLLAVGSDDNSEPNDICAEARSLDSFFNSSLTGLVVKAFDEDWYSITVPAFGSVSFHAGFEHADGDIDLRLHSACGSVLASSGSLTNHETINWTNSTASPRVVQLRVFLASDVRNSYFLDVARYAPTPPSNDSCATQQRHNLGFRNDGSTIAANVSASSSCDGAFVGGDVFFFFISDCERPVTLTTEGSDFDTVLSVSRDCNAGGVEIACNDDAQPNQRYSQLTFTALGGTAYTVRISGYNGAVGRYTLSSSVPSGVPNDRCQDAIEIAEGTLAFSNCSAFTNGSFEESCFGFGEPQVFRDLYYSWTAPCYGTLEVDTVGSIFDTRLALYRSTGSPCNPGPNRAIACNDDMGFLQPDSLISAPVDAGATYLIRVGSKTQALGGPGVLNVRFVQQPPAGDTCATAPDIDLGAHAWYTCASTSSGPDEPCLVQPAMYQGRWLAYTPPCNGTLQLDTLGYAIDTSLSIASSCDPLSTLACSDNVNELGESSIELAVQANTRYLLRVASSVDQGTIQLIANLAFTSAPVCIDSCDPIDFNADSLFPDDQDLIDFLSVLAGGECSPGNTCNDIDFNNDELFPDDSDLIAFLRVLAGGSC